MKRICIIGGPGSGKTTLANNLGKKLNLPVCHIDGINHLEKWQLRDKKERDEIIISKSNEDKWVIDGNYITTLNARLEKSDFVIFLDYSTFTRVNSVLHRYIKIRGKERPEIPGCKEKLDYEFLKFVLKWNKEKRPKIYALLDKIDSSKVHIFKSRKKLHKWYNDTFNEKYTY